MPEGVHGYPRWQGTLRRFPAFPVIAGQEIRRAYHNTWGRAMLTLVVAYPVLYLGSLWTLKQTRGDSVHTMDAFLAFVETDSFGILGLRWFVLALAAIMAGPALLEDIRRGALELYLSRAVTQADYLAGKVLAILGLTTGALWAAMMVYWGGAYVMFDAQPEGWAWLPFRALGYALIWSVFITGVGLGISLLTRSSRAATILLFGGIAVIDIILSDLLSAITRDGRWNVLSPLASLTQQTGWLFGVEAPFEFPWWWGAIHLGGVALLGWAVVAWRRPRLAGVS